MKKTVGERTWGVKRGHCGQKKEQGTTAEREWRGGNTSVGYVFPGGPLAPGWEDQRVSGANPQLTDALRQQDDGGAFSLQWDRSHSEQKKQIKSRRECLDFLFTLPSSFNTYSIWCSRLKKLWGVDQLDGGATVTLRSSSPSWHVTIWGLSGLTGRKKERKSCLYLPFF